MWAAKLVLGMPPRNPAELDQLDHSAAALFAIAAQPQTACPSIRAWNKAMRQNCLPVLVAVLLGEKGVALLPDGQCLPVVREAHVFQRDAGVTVHQSHEVVAPVGDAQLVQQVVLNGQESRRTF